MIDMLKDIDDLKAFMDGLPSETAICAASVRGMPMALVKAFETEDVILPVIFLKGIEYGKEIDEEYDHQYSYVKDLVSSKYGDSKTLLPPMVYSNIELWRLLSVTYSGAIQKKLGYHNACIGCRAYMHIAQIHIASLTKRKTLIYGEKPNNKKTQLKEDKTRTKMKPLIEELERRYDINAYSPMSSYVDIDDAIKACGGSWLFIKEEPACIFVKSNLDIEGKPIEHDVDTLLSSFLIPSSNMIVNLLNTNPKAGVSEIKNCIVQILRGQ